MSIDHRVIASQLSIDFGKELDGCSRAGGGRVTVPKGTYLSYTLSLRDNVDRTLDRRRVVRTAVARGTKISDIPRRDRRRSQHQPG